jgi:HD-like signal output (HDOD) protein
MMGWFRQSGSSNGAGKPEQPRVDPAADTDTAPGPAVAVADSVEPPAELADFFLLLEDHLTGPELEDLEKALDAPKQPPLLLDRVSRGLDDPEELKEAIMSSPALSSDVLRVVNSAAFALSTPISSIDEALVYLGTNLVKGLVLQATVTQVMNFSTGVQQAAYMRLWKSSYAASAAALSIATAAQYEHPQLLATRALLSNVGDLALIAAQPAMAYLYAPNSGLFARLEAQQREIMANSAILNSLLARRWKLPEDLRDALHHAFTPLAWAPAANPRQGNTRKEDIILYTAICLGHDVAFRGLEEVGDFTLERPEELEFFHLPTYYAETELPRPERVFEQRKFAAHVQNVIESVSG